MDTGYLRTFLEIVRRGSFSDAAHALGLTQPAVTFQVQRLERDLGARLLERGHGPIRLTTEGEEFRRRAERILFEEDALREGLANLAHEVRGHLSIAASTVPGEFVAPSLLADFFRLHPGSSASMTIADTDAVIESVLRGDCDLGLTGAQADNARLEQHAFVRDPVVLIVPINHPFSQKRSVTAVELANEAFVTRETGSGTMATVSKILRDAGLADSSWGATTVLGSTQAVISGVQAGLGVAFVSAFAAATPVKAGTIVALTVEGVRLERHLYIAYQVGRLSTRLQREFVGHAQTWGEKLRPPLAL
ncbi:MAG: LysR family transcriptional regulator [Chloroflexi bacterium]|nr:LysR family transcriptional regulator [Chloroflexota bacterium]